MSRRPKRKVRKVLPSPKERRVKRERSAKKELDRFIEPSTIGKYTYIFLGTEKSEKAAEKKCRKEGYKIGCETRMTPQILQEEYRFKKYSAFGKLRTRLFSK